MSSTAVRRGAPDRARAFLQVWSDSFGEHDLLTAAGAIAFRMLIALVPLVLLGAALLGATGQESVWDTQIGPAVESRVTLPVFSGIDYTFQLIFQDSSGGLIAFALLLAVWDVSGAVRACMSGVNKIYETKETRPTWLRFGISIALAVAVGAAVIGAFVLVVSAPKIFDHGAAHVAADVLRWPIAIALLGSAIDLLLRFGPAKPRALRWDSLGSALVVAAWLGTSLLFGWYVVSVADFRTAAGTLTAFLILTTYLYSSAIVFLVGVQLDELLRADLEGTRRGVLERLIGRS